MREVLVITNGSRLFKFSDFEQRGIADLYSIEKIANDLIRFMKDYINESKGEEYKVLTKKIIWESIKG